MTGARRAEVKDSFTQIEQLFEDLRKVKVKIEDYLLMMSDVPFSKNTKKFMHKLEEVRVEYSSILRNVEKGHKAVKSLKDNQESIDNDKSETTDSTYDSNIRNSNLKNINNEHKINQPKSTLVYQLKTETHGVVEGFKPDNLGRTMQNSKLKLHKSRSVVIEGSSKTQSPYKYNSDIMNKDKAYGPSAEQQLDDHFSSDSGNNSSFDAESKNIKKQISNLQHDDSSIKSDVSPPLATTDRKKNSKYEPKHRSDRSSPIMANRRSGTSRRLVTKKSKILNEEDFTKEVYTVDQPVDGLKKKMDLKEKEIQSLKQALKAAEKSNKHGADRLRSSKVSDEGISEKLLHKSHECDELLAENIKLRKTIDGMGLEVRDLELANLQLKNAKESLEITKEKNAEENSQLMNRLQILQEEIEKGREISKMKDQLSDRLAKVMVELHECKDSNKEQKDLLSAMKLEKDCKILQLEKKIECLIRENQDNYLTKKELEEKSKCLEIKNDELSKSYEKRLSDQCDRLRMAETRAIKLEEKIPAIDVQRELEDQKRINQILNEDVKRLKDENMSLKCEKHEMSKQTEMREKVFNTIANENECLKNARMFSDSACRDLETELALLRSEKIRLEYILNCSTERSMEFNENKNQLLHRISDLEQQKINLLYDLERANQELMRLRDENNQRETKYQQILLQPCEKRSVLDDDSIDMELQTDNQSVLATTGTSKHCNAFLNNMPGCTNIQGCGFSISNGIRRPNFHGHIQNKSPVEPLSQVYAVAIPTTEADGRPKSECKKRLLQRKKC